MKEYSTLRTWGPRPLLFRGISILIENEKV